LGDLELLHAPANGLSSADPHGVTVCQQAFGFCQSFDRMAEAKEAVAGDGLRGDALHKIRR
jgi:hypothetical protein